MNSGKVKENRILKNKDGYIQRSDDGIIETIHGECSICKQEITVGDEITIIVYCMIFILII